MSDEDRDMSTALMALHIAAAAIEKMADIKAATADNDDDSGEIVFTTKGGRSFVLKLQNYEED